MARRTALKAVSAEAERFVANILRIIREAQKAGATTLREIATALNALGCRHRTRRSMAPEVGL
jgi:hypothetical protein